MMNANDDISSDQNLNKIVSGYDLCYVVGEHRPDLQQ